MTGALQTAIQTKLESLSGLDSTNVFYVRAKHSTDYPYLVWQGITETPELDSINKHEMDIIQLTLRGTDAHVSTIKTWLDTLKSSFEWTTISVTGWTNIQIKPMTGTPLNVLNDVWQTTKDYQLWNYAAR